MARLFLKELLQQLALIDEAMQDIRNRGTTDVWGTRILREDREEYRDLAERRRKVRKQIINYEV